MTTIPETGKLTAGEHYDQGLLQCVGWDGPAELLYDASGNRNPGLDGYSCWDYFDSESRYLGPDMHGVEPLFSAAH